MKSKTVTLAALQSEYKMASNWIKVEVITPDKPEIYHLAERLSLDPDAVLGKLIRLWVWVDQQTIDGNANCNAASVTKNAIDRITFATGFADALISVGTGDCLRQIQVPAYRREATVAATVRRGFRTYRRRTAKFHQVSGGDRP